MGEVRAAVLLDLVHLAVLAADYPSLAELEGDLVREMGRSDFRLTAAELKMIQQKALRNAACLKAAGRGIKAARQRLSDIRSAASRLVTYDRSGKRAEFSESRNLAQRL